MKNTIKLILLLLCAQACGQAKDVAPISYELKAYDFENLPEGVSNLQYKVYPENTVIASGVYQNISEAKNESLEGLLTSSLSENSLEWYRKNRDYKDDKDNEDVLEGYKEWLEKEFNFKLVSMMTYEYQNYQYALVVMEMYIGDIKAPYIYSEGCIKKNNQWYIIDHNPSDLLSFIIGNKNIHPHSAYNIYNKKPQNEGERLLLAQSLNEKGELDFEKLSTALETIQEQAAKNEDIRKILLIEDFE